MDSIKKRHSNKKLATLIRQSRNMIVGDVLAICSMESRAQTESDFIHKLFGDGHKLTNITDPINPRKKLTYLTKGKK
jgi:D-arabinose 5-phosphate isomerase GutQ